jgi:hypothetical protein
MNNTTFSSPFAAKFSATSSYSLTASYAMNGGSGGISGIGVSIDGGGDIISSGIHGMVQVPKNCVATSWRMFADEVGYFKVDVWKTTFANFPATIANTILGTGNELTISNAQKAEDVDLSNWISSSFSEGDIVVFYVPEASTTITKATLQIFVQ